MIDIKIGQKVLITTDNWFHGPDGRQYRAVFGTLKAISSSEQTLGIKTNSKSTNWYVMVGNMLVAGCQIHYAIRCDSCNTSDVSDFQITEGKLIEYTRPSYTFNADACSCYE